MTATDASTTPARRMPVWLLGTIMGVFGLLYAYAVWNAIGNLIASVQAAGEVGKSLNGLGWFVWIIAIAVPLIVYVLAFALSYRRSAVHAFLVMLAGLALVAVLWLDIVSYTARNTASLLG